MLFYHYHVTHNRHFPALLSSDFAGVMQLCYSQAVSAVILLATGLILCQSRRRSASVIPLYQSCCLPISCYIANITVLATVINLCHCLAIVMLICHCHAALPLLYCLLVMLYAIPMLLGHCHAA